MGQREWNLWKDGFVKGFVIAVFFSSILWTIGIIIYKILKLS